MKIFLNASMLLIMLTACQMAYSAGSKQDSTKTSKKETDTAAVASLDKVQKIQEKQLKLAKHDEKRQKHAQKIKNRRLRVNDEMAKELKRKKERDSKRYPPNQKPENAK